jgi:glutathione S-transferase
VRQYLLAYFFPRDPERRPDRAAIDAALPNMEKHFAVLDRAVARTGHLVGDSFTLADMNLLPILFFMDKAREGRALLGRSTNLKAYYERHQARASVKDTIPPPLPGRSSWEIEA